MAEGCKPPYFMKILPLLLPTPFFCPPLPPTFLLPPTPTPTVFSVVMFLWLNGWSYHIRCAILLNDNIDLHTSHPRTLVPEGPWCVFYVRRRQVYICGYLLVSWLDITLTNTKTHTAHSAASRLTHPYKYIFAPAVMCSQQLTLLH